jgi:uncharacterized protein YjbI with pentapeptide repeats
MELAYLHDANFTGADLGGANFTNATTQFTVFGPLI